MLVFMCMVHASLAFISTAHYLHVNTNEDPMHYDFTPEPRT